MKLLKSTFAALGLAVSLQAGMVYSNGTPDNFDSTAITIGRSADDFALTSTTSVAAVRFWIDMWFYQDISTFSGQMSYSIYNSTGSTTLASGTVDGLTPTPTGQILVAAYQLYSLSAPVFQVEMNLASAVTLDAGNYLLELHTGDSMTSTVSTVNQIVPGTNVVAPNPTGPAVWWVTANETGSSLYSTIGGGVPHAAAPADLAFQLFDTPFAATPEPASGLLILGGLALVGFRARRT